MRKLLLLLLLASSSAHATCGSTGFGATLGVGTTDNIQSTYNDYTLVQISYSMWFYQNGAGGGSIGRLWDATSNNLNVGDIFDDAVSGANWGYQRNFSTANGAWFFPPPSTLTWHHLCLTYDDSATANKPTIYIDGVSQTVSTSLTPTGTAVTTNSPVIIGNRQTSLNRNWDGKLADFAKWSGLLSANECVALAKGQSPLNVRPATLKFYFPLCNNPSGVQPDLSSAHASQTVTGTKAQNGAPNSGFPYQPSGN